MNSLQTLKLTQFNTDQKTTTRNVANAISSLNTAMSEAIKHQTYARKNPDSIIDNEMLASMGVAVDSLLVSYNEIAEKCQDLIKVKDGQMTVEELHTKYPFDLLEYSERLM